MGSLAMYHAKAVAVTDHPLEGLDPVDAARLNPNDPVLCVGQADSSENGVWLARPGSWVRARGIPLASASEDGITALVGSHGGATYWDTTWFCRDGCWLQMISVPKKGEK